MLISFFLPHACNWKQNMLKHFSQKISKYYLKSSIFVLCYLYPYFFVHFTSSFVFIGIILNFVSMFVDLREERHRYQALLIRALNYPNWCACIRPPLFGKSQSADCCYSATNLAEWMNTNCCIQIYTVSSRTLCVCVILLESKRWGGAVLST